MQDVKRRPLTVVSGDNELFKEEFISKTLASIKDLDETSVHRFNITGKEEHGISSEIIEKASTVSFFSPVSVVILRNFEKLTAAEEKKVLEFLEKIPEHAVIIASLGYDERDLKKKYDKTPLLGGVVKVFSSGSASEIKKWAALFLKELGKEADTALIEKILEESNSDVLIFRGELEKTALLSGERARLSEEDFDAVKGVKKGHDVWELTAAVSDLNEAAALRLLDEVLETDEPQKIMGALFLPVYEVFIVRYYLSKNNEQGALKYLKNNPGKLYALKKKAGNFSRTRLIDLLLLLKDADMAIKRSGPERAKVVLTMLIQSLILKVKEDLDRK